MLPTYHKGVLEGQMIVDTFGIVHTPVLDSLPAHLRPSDADASDFRPLGALVLAAVGVRHANAEQTIYFTNHPQVERALRMWGTGEFIRLPGTPGNFCADVWADKTKQTNGVKKKRKRIRLLMKAAREIDNDSWHAILLQGRKAYLKRRSLDVIVVTDDEDADEDDEDDDSSSEQLHSEG